MQILTRLLFFALTFFILLGIIYFVPAPKSWAQANTFQILLIFIPLLLTSTFLANIFLNNFPRSFSIGLGVLMLSTLLALGQFNTFTATALMVASGLLFYLMPRRRLTRNPKIPKLTLGRKQKSSNLKDKHRIKKLKI